MISKPVIQLLVGVALAGLTATALYLSTSSVAGPTPSAVPAKADGGALAFIVAPAQGKMAIRVGLNPVQVGVRRLMP